MSDLLQLLSRSGPAAIEWLIAMNASTALLAIVAYGVDRALARRVAAGWRLWLYAAVLARLAWPAALTITIPFALALPFGSHRPSGAATRAPAPELRTPESSLARSSSAVAGADDSVSTARVLWLAPALAYACVAVLLALRWRRAATELRRVRDRSEPLAVASPIPVRVHATLGPVLVGVRRPTLIIPDSLRRPECRHALESVIAHESAHCARRDPMVAAILHAIVIVAWPIVPLWFVASRCRVLMELACDERATLGRSSDERRSYAEALIELASSPRTPRPALAFAGGLRERIGALRAAPRWRPSVQVGAASIMATALVACAALRGEGPGRPAGRTEPQVLTHASFEPSKGTTELSFTVLRGWPGRGADERASQAAPAWVVLLTKESAHELTTRADSSVLAAPRIYSYLGLPATLTIGSTVDAGGGRAVLVDGMTIDATIRNIFTRPDTFAVDRFQLAIGYFEATRGGSSWQSGEQMLELPPDRVGAIYIKGPVAADDRLLLVSARKPVTEAVAKQTPPQRSDPLGGAYPQVFWMLNVYEVPVQPEVRPDGTLVVASGVKANGSAVVLADRVLPALESIDAFAGARMIAAPAIIAKFGTEASIGSDDEDKPGASIGSRTIRIRSDEAPDGVRASTEIEARAAGSSVSSRISDRTIPPGGALIHAVPGPSSDLPWTVVVLRPTVLRSIDDYPFQKVAGPPPGR